MNGRPAFILLDANNFYVSAERVWRPELANKPVVVAGSRDGCVIARSDEAKALGIKMSAPLHLVRQQHWRSGLIICSANFPLYGGASSRLMRTVAPVGSSGEGTGARLDRSGYRRRDWPNTDPGEARLLRGQAGARTLSPMCNSHSIGGLAFTRRCSSNRVFRAFMFDTRLSRMIANFGS